MMREYIKKSRKFIELMSSKIKNLSEAVGKMNPELQTMQEVFSYQLYPAIGLVRASIMFQRMDPFKAILTPDFRDFIKKKAVADTLPDGSDCPPMQYLMDDPDAVCAEFNKHIENKAKEKDIFVKKKPPKPTHAAGSAKSNKKQGCAGPRPQTRIPRILGVQD